MNVKWLRCVRLFATPWTVAYQAPLSMGFSRQQCWNGLPFPSPRDLPNPGIEPGSPTSRQTLYHLSHQGSPRNIWSNRQIWPWTTEWSRAKASRVLPRKRTGHSKHPRPTTQEKTPHVDITRWSIPKSDWLYSLQRKMEKLYTINKNWLWLRSWTPYCQIQT